jgi:cell division protease FtsH
MGGRVAEEMTFGKENITSGASGDIEQATRMARAMVTRYGYSDELGTVMYGENQDEVFLGMSMGRTQSVSEATSQKIDAEVRRLINQGWEDAKRILTEKHNDLETLAQALLEYETLTGDEIRDLLNGKPPSRDPTDEPAAARGSAIASGTKPRRRPPQADSGGLEPAPLA